MDQGYELVELEFRGFLVMKSRNLELGWGRYDLSKFK
jgi:hypothetical protein